MAYDLEATGGTPALIIYLLDVSDSMRGNLEGARKIDHVNQALAQVLEQMAQRSTRGQVISLRYKLAMYIYSDQVEDFLDGVKTIDETAEWGAPTLSVAGTTNTAAAFMEARSLLERELPNLQRCPAPMVCHLTDGEYNRGADPEPIARKIMQMSNDDGNVLVENIFVGADLTHKPISNPKTWTGISDASELKSQYAKKLFDMSSPLPDRYAAVLAEGGYALEPGSRMLYPGTNYDLIELAFAVSEMTGVAKSPAE